MGDLAKPELRALLRERGIRLNRAAEDLFAHGSFLPAKQARTLRVAARSVADLGFSEGATYDPLVARARESGLMECPLELGPYLRLQYLEQPAAPVDHPSAQPGAAPGAPAGAITIASPPLDASDETPKGFYLRKLGPDLWLRGYRASPDHLWRPQDVFLLALAAR